MGIIDIDRNNNSILCKNKFEYETDLANKIRELELENKHLKEQLIVKDEAREVVGSEKTYLVRLLCSYFNSFFK